MRELQAEPPLVLNEHKQGCGPALRVRGSTPGDLDAIARLETVFWDASRSSPSFSGMPIRSHADERAEWSDVWDDDAYAHAVAELDGRVVGHVLLYRRPEGDLRVPPRSVDLAHAVTDPDLRGRGVGLALVEWAVAWAHEHDRRAATVDWREPNLWASRFWPRRGFRPQLLRLYRAVP